jgi:hypothetical protein
VPSRGSGIRSAAVALCDHLENRIIVDGRNVVVIGRRGQSCALREFAQVAFVGVLQQVQTIGAEHDAQRRFRHLCEPEQRRRRFARVAAPSGSAGGGDRLAGGEHLANEADRCRVFGHFIGERHR